MQCPLLIHINTSLVLKYSFSLKRFALWPFYKVVIITDDSEMLYHQANILCGHPIILATS